MLIKCTKDMQTELGLKEFSEQEEPIFSWHAKFFTMNRKKAAIFKNDATGYVILLHGLKKSDLSKLPELFLYALRESLHQIDITGDVIDEYIEKAGAVAYGKTSSRSLVSKLNNAALVSTYYDTAIRDDRLIQTEWGWRLCTYPERDPDNANAYELPYKAMAKHLEVLIGRKARKISALQLKITLDLEYTKVWRRVIVPSSLKFRSFHNLIQELFSWNNCHLYEFYTYGNEKNPDDGMINHPAYHPEGYRPVAAIIGGIEEDFYEEYEDPHYSLTKYDDRYVRLKDFKFEHAKYVYDLGDFWQHYIEVEERFDDYSSDRPICIDGEGEPVPEDVGGTSGYNALLKVIGNPSDPEYKETKEWYEGTGIKKFDIREINFKLSYIYSL